MENLKNNIKQELDNGYIQCEICGKRVEDSGKTKKYCTECFNKQRRKYKTQKQRDYRNINKICGQS